MNCYLISSASYHLLNEEIKKITNDSSNITNYNLEEDSLDSILEDASYISLFDEMKYLIINNANLFVSDKTNDEEVELLLKYLDNLNSNTTLIFTTSGNPNYKKKIVKIFKEKYQIIIIESYTEIELSKKINKIFKENNKTISNFGVNYLIEACNSNYDLIISEINKILIYLTNQNAISDEEVRTIVSVSNAIDNYSFSDAIIAKNMEKSYKCLDELKIINVDSSLLIGLLASQYRLLLQVKILENNSNEEIAKRLNIHPYRVKIARDTNYKYLKEEIEKHILMLGELDLKIKKGLLDGYHALELFILTIG